MAVVTGTATARSQPTTAWAERCFDVTITLLFLPLVTLVGAMIAVAIYLDSPGPVMYRSRRIGRGGEPFEMLKFRKMRRDAACHPVTLDEDARFTPIGRFLAATRLDELPQVWNVLRGEMRLVGPRPELECFVAEYPEEYADILRVAPGITGNAQLRFLNERHLLACADPVARYSAHVLPVKIEIDLDYAADHSLIGDLGILVRTALAPLGVLAERLRTPGSELRKWIPATVSSALLALLFILVSGHLP